MDWHEVDGRWRSGPYVIELDRPGVWVLRRDMDDDARVHQTDSTVTGKSLQQMKRAAEEMEEAAERLAARKRHLVQLFLSLLVFLMVAGASGQWAAIVAVAAAGYTLYALTLVMDDFGPRPWDSLREYHQ